MTGQLRPQSRYAECFDLANSNSQRQQKGRDCRNQSLSSTSKQSHRHKITVAKYLCSFCGVRAKRLKRFVCGPCVRVTEDMWRREREGDAGREQLNSTCMKVPLPPPSLFAAKRCNPGTGVGSNSTYMCIYDTYVLSLLVYDVWNGRWPVLWKVHFKYSRTLGVECCSRCVRVGANEEKKEQATNMRSLWAGAVSRRRCLIATDDKMEDGSALTGRIGMCSNTSDTSPV